MSTILLIILIIVLIGALPAWPCIAAAGGRTRAAASGWWC